MILNSLKNYLDFNIVNSSIKYLSLVFAATAGYFIFGEALKITTLVGALFIVVGTYIIFRREETLKKQVVPPRYET